MKCPSGHDMTILPDRGMEWKQMGIGEYVCGIEPANSYPRGRAIEKKEGNVRYIEPGEKLDFRLEFNVLKLNSDIEEFKNSFL